MEDAAVSRLDGPRLSRRVGRYVPLLFWMAFIAFASSGELSASNTSRIIRPLLLWLFPDISAERLMTMHLLARKSAHFVEYFVLGLLAARAFATSSLDLLKRNWFRWSILLIGIYALLDEYHQSFVPSRTGSIYDSLIDLTGGLTALFIYKSWLRRSQIRPS
jgi:VanZ family protein